MIPKREQSLKYYFAACCIFISTVLSGQCPDRTVLWERITQLRDQQVNTGEQFRELDGYRKQMKTCAQPGDTLYAFLLQRLGVLYYNQSDYTHAISITHDAIKLLNEGRDSPDKFSRLVNCYGNLGYYYQKLGLNQERERVNDSCIVIAVNRKIVSQPLLDVIAKREGELVKSGDYEHCLRIAQMGEISAAGTEFEGSKFMYPIATWKINSLIELGNLEEAQEEVTRRIALYENGKDTGYLATTLIQQGNIFTKKGNFSRALDQYNLAFVYSKAANFTAGCASSLNSIGFLYTDKLHDYNAGLFYFQLALKYEDPGEVLSILDNVANLYAAKGQYDSSFYYFNLALDKVLPGLTESNLSDKIGDLLQSNNAEYVITLVLDKAELWLKRYSGNSKKEYLDSALTSYRRTDLVLDKLRRTYTGSVSKLFWRSNTHRLYERAIESSQLSGDLESAFYFFEKSRAALLNDVLAEQRWLGREDIGREAAIRKDLLYLQRNLAVMGDSLPRYKEIQQEIFSRNQDLIQLEKDIRERNPIFYKNIVDTSMVGYATLQSLLQSNDQWMVETYSGDSAVYVLTITRNSGWIKKLNKREYDQLAFAYVSFLENPASMNKNFLEFQETSGHLYQLIFGEGALPNGRIIISQDGHYFPFESLVNGAGVSGPHYLLEDYPMSYTYSARYLMSNLSMPVRTQGQEFLGIAPVDFGLFPGLGNLAASDESLKKLGKYFNHSTLLMGKEATRNGFLDQFQKYDIIQLYSHGADTSSNGEPVIYFSDSALYLSDLIGGVQPLTRLIVLSACETGTGRLYRGEGVFGFNRGFAALGIPSSITNLWSVNNEATYRITELFYQYLTKGFSTDVALQKAKLDYLHSASGEMKLPNYWAAAILVGKTDQFAVEKPTNWKIILIPILLLFLLTLFILYILKRRARKS